MYLLSSGNLALYIFAGIIILRTFLSIASLAIRIDSSFSIFMIIMFILVLCSTIIPIFKGIKKYSFFKIIWWKKYTFRIYITKFASLVALYTYYINGTTQHYWSMGRRTRLRKIDYTWICHLWAKYAHWTLRTRHNSYER